jgi:ABC-2 type transport system ATP-binding protein
MKRRLNFACALLHRPKVLLLDEPTVGVDPQSRERIFAAVREQAAAGTSVLYSTHYMEEAEQLCDRVVLIDAGRVVASGTPAELIERFGGDSQLDVATRAALPANWLEGVAGARSLGGPQADDGHFRTRVALDDIGGAAAVLERAARHGVAIVDFRLHQPSLQDVFLQLTGREMRD